MFYVLVIPLSAQPVPRDSLLRILEATREPRARTDLLLQLASDYYDIDTDLGYKYASEAYELAQRIQYTAGMCESLTLKGYYFYATGEYVKALNFYYRSMAVPGHPPAQQGYTFIMTGNAYRSQSRYDSAETYYHRGIALLSTVDSPFLPFAYKNLARLYVLQWKNAEAQEYFNRALSLYEQQFNSAGKAETLFLLSEVSLHQSDYGEANSFIARGCGLASRAGSPLLEIRCLLNEGRMLQRAGEYTRALDKFFAIIAQLKGRTLPDVLMDVYYATGEVYDALGQNDLALKYFFASLKIADKAGVKYMLAQLYCSIGWVYKNQFNFGLAHEFVSKSEKLREAIGDVHGLSHCYNVSGLIYYQEKQYDRAIALLEQSLAIRRNLAYREGISACIFNLGLVYEEMGDLTKALTYQLEALGIDEQIGNPYGLGISYNNLGGLYTKLRDYTKAESYLRRGEKMGLTTESRSLQMNNALQWSRFYEVRGNFRRALEHQKTYTSLHDSIFSDNSAGRLAELQALYQLEKKDEEILALNTQRQLQDDKIRLQHAKLTLQNFIIASVIICFLFVSLFAVKSYQYTRTMRRANHEIVEQKEEIQAQSEELIEANQLIAQSNRQLELKVEERTSALRQAYQELDTFFYRSSHDFRRPLTTFMGLAEVAKITVKDPNALELFSRVSETASNLDRMLVKLQSISDVGAQQLVYREVLIRDIFETLCDTFREELDRKHIKTFLDIELTGPFYSYPAMVKIILENLLENSVFFSGMTDPFVRLRVLEQGDMIVLEFSDNGQGIDKQYQDRVFEMYFRGSDRSKGNGLGLYIVRKAVEKLGGHITFESVLGEGSTFWVYLPMRTTAG